MATTSAGLDDDQTERAAGVLIGLACGDALGVPYEHAEPPDEGQPAEMRGGGPAGLAPGEWSDDTAMAVAIAEVVASGADLTTVAGLDAVAERFLAWYDSGPADIGGQTAAVLAATRERVGTGPGGGSPAEVMTREAGAYAEQHEHSAGNGALMRTAAVTLGHLDDREGLAKAAAGVARLTHDDPVAVESCVLWSEAVRVAIVGGLTDVRAGLDLLPPSRRADWAAWIDDALNGPAAKFTPNGYTVTALQAATSSVVLTPATLDGSPDEHLQDGLHAAVRIGDDTDTVAAIAGSLLGAKWGAGAVPEEWVGLVHGWPGRTGEDLVTLARVAAHGGPSGAV